MNTLGIDYGDAKVGLAVSTGKLASPLKVIKYKDINKLIQKIINIIKEKNISNIVVGISEGKSAQKSKAFAELLKAETGLEVKLVDETLSTQDAQQMAIEAGMGLKKRKTMEDALAASVILQSYLDSRI